MTALPPSSAMNTAEGQSLLGSTTVPTAVAVSVVTGGCYVVNIVSLHMNYPIDTMLAMFLLSMLFSLYLTAQGSGKLVQRCLTFVFNTFIIAYLAIGSFNTTQSIVDNANSPPASQAGTYEVPTSGGH